MRSVAGIIGIGPIDVGVVIHKIVSIDIIYESVAVVIDAVSGNLARVHPHVGGQVGIGIAYAFVHHGHNDIRVTAGQVFPYILHVDVGAFDSRGRIGFAALVVVVPLVLEHRIIEGTAYGPLGGEHFGSRVGNAVRSLLRNAIVLGHLYLIQCRQAQDGAVYILPLLQGHFVPAVQAEPVLQFFLPLHRVEEGFHRQHAVLVAGRQVVGRRNRAELHHKGRGSIFVSQLHQLGLGIGNQFRLRGLQLCGALAG